ncbi:MAG: hypothetical protein KDB88_00385, partial [Flavobacteriales bacterium]|nr:hypothetical protein [Flavobacteriales bacterium]
MAHTRSSFLIALILPIMAFGQAGTLDLSFNGTGYTSTAIGTNNDLGRAVLQQADGKIVVAGMAVIGAYFDLALVRYMPDGSLDASFGSGGYTTAPVQPIRDEAYDLAIRPTGEYVVAGRSGNGTTDDYAVAQFTSNGMLDAGFGNAGVAFSDLVSNEQFNALALQNDGKIVAAGSMAGFGGLLIRFNADGTLDNTFGTAGIVTSIVPGTTGGVFEDVVIQTDGKIIVVGSFVGGMAGNWTVARFNSDGTPDLSFGSNGFTSTDIGTLSSLPEEARAAALDANGRIVVAGHARNSLDLVVARYLSDGSLDAA